MGVDTRRTQVYLLFAGAMGVLVMARGILYAPPRARLDCRLPFRATAGVPVAVHARVTGVRRPEDLCLLFPRPIRWGASIRFLRRETLVTSVPDRAVEVAVEVRPARRGRYVLRAPTLRATDPLGLATGPARRGPEHTLLVYPPYYTLEAFPIPAGRRYQPGGIPLSSNTGDAIEFVGTRDWRQGDPIRNIHWRSWARRGAPVVKEHQEEYFSRIALVLDTFVPRRPRAADERAFESAISVLASIADFYSRSDHVVDILAAGPEVYDVSTGRSLAYLENILDVLSCLEPCREPSFEVVGPALFDRLAQITTVVAVLQDWDPARESFLREVRARGTAVHVIVVREGGTTRPVASAGELGTLEALTPAEVHRRVAASRAASPPAAALRA